MKNETMKLVMISEIPLISEGIIRALSRKLDIDLASPEKEIVRQGVEDSEGMFFIQSGECFVMI